MLFDYVDCFPQISTVDEITGKIVYQKAENYAKVYRSGYMYWVYIYSFLLNIGLYGII